MTTTSQPNYDREAELKAFDATKAGVKGLVDSGITTVPRIFLHPQSNKPNSQKVELKFPLIDLNDIVGDPIKRKAAVDEIRHASETWGFFQVINHGIPGSILGEMLDRVRRFFEEDDEEKRKWYTRDLNRRVVYNSNFDLYSSPAANWRDTVYCRVAPDLPAPAPEELPEVFRDIIVEYTNEVMRLGKSLFEMLSEALGLKANHLEEMKCGNGLDLLLHYYPVCPQPELTMGTTHHADSDFLTVLLNDKVDGLQVLYQNQWVDVPPLPGSLVVNIGDLLQLVANDKFISAEHRVLANNAFSRVSIACFFRNDADASTKLYGPIEQLLSEDNPPKYRATTVGEYVAHFNMKGLDGTSALSRFRV